MADVDLSIQEKEIIVQKIQDYFTEELDQEIDQFDAEFLLEFFLKKIGPVFYNQGLHDAQAVLMKRLDSITDAIYDIEKPIDFRR